MSRRRLVAVLAALVAFAAPSAALAGPGTHQYTNPVQEEQPPKASTPLGAEKAKEGTLPFTGLDLTLVIAAGGFLATSGVIVRRRLRKHGS